MRLLIVILFFQVPLFLKAQELKNVLIEDTYLKTANLSRSAFDISKRIYFADKPALKNSLSDSLLIILEEVVFNTGILLKDVNVQKKVKSVLEDVNKKTVSYTGKVKDIKKESSLEGKDAITEKIIFYCGSMVVNSYYAYLTITDNNPNLKGKLPKNTNLNDTLELLNADKATNFLFMKEYINHNSMLAFQIRDLQKYLATTMPKEERELLEKEYELLKAEKVKNDHLLLLTVVRLNQTREKIIHTIIEGYDMHEDFKMYDKNKDGKINLDEIYSAIDLFLEGKTDLEPEMIYALIDFYFEAE
ncbi:MAG: hypothetical protein M3Q58_17355 [Bacteroidota bacterium]|nr:hypothetical protein [Bacteroidota bacterium]